MTSRKNAVVLVVISFLVVFLIYSSVTKRDVFALPQKGPPACKVSQDINSRVFTKTCCWYEWDADQNGKLVSFKHFCQDCRWDAFNDYGCGNPYEPRQLAGTGGPISVGPTQPSSTPPPPSNETHANNQPGHIGTKQSLTTTCPNGSAPDADGFCPTAPTFTTNHQGGLTSNNNDNTNSHQGHHHKGINPSAQIEGGVGQELTATKNKDQNLIK